MTLIPSISGIRGTIGGKQGASLSPADVVKFTSAFASFILKRNPGRRLKVVLGRDARISGKMISDIVAATLQSCGIDVLDIGLTTTPTAELAVTLSGSGGGIIITASHNPQNWNALKLLNHHGEFLSADDGKELEAIARSGETVYAGVDRLGSCERDDSYLDRHIRMILDLPLVDIPAISKARYSFAVDAVNSTGGIAVPKLLKALGVQTVHELHCTPDGRFPHNPEPLPENLTDLSELVVKKKADGGLAVDPDVDRLAIMTEEGEPFGEEYTLVAAADYVLGRQPGNTVSNLSSTQALKDITLKHGGNYFASAVGEVNVVEKMKEVSAVIGGEGNGGVIYPELHYGRDALAGIALFLSGLARSGRKVSALRDGFPSYYISKHKIEMDRGTDMDRILSRIAERYSGSGISKVDGVRIKWEREWVHLRRSNTEPVIRIYAESDMPEKADHLAKKILEDLREILNES